MYWPLKVTDCIAAVGDNNPNRRRVGDIDHVMVHRIELFDDDVLCDDAVTMAAEFLAHPEWTGSPCMPYTFLVTTGGDFQQALPLTLIAPHAWRWNERALSVGFIGDFRTNEPTIHQAACANTILPLLALAFGYEADNLVGHIEPGLSKTTRHRNKVCPGQHMDPNTLRNLAKNTVQVNVRKQLRDAGMVIP